MRFAARAATIAFFVFWHLVRWAAVWVALVAALRPRARRQAWFGDCLLALFRDLGATFIKVGQIMSTRPDLLPPHVIAALEKLQDQVGPFDYPWVQRTFLEDFGRPPEEIFEEFAREPIASASVAQVHRARLPGGRVVAVKVRRPKIDRIVQQDRAEPAGCRRHQAGAGPLPREGGGFPAAESRPSWIPGRRLGDENAPARPEGCAVSAKPSMSILA